LVVILISVIGANLDDNIDYNVRSLVTEASTKGNASTVMSVTETDEDEDEYITDYVVNAKRIGNVVEVTFEHKGKVLKMQRYVAETKEK